MDLVCNVSNKPILLVATLLVSMYSSAFVPHPWDASGGDSVMVASSRSTNGPSVYAPVPFGTYPMVQPSVQGWPFVGFGWNFVGSSKTKDSNKKMDNAKVGSRRPQVKSPVTMPYRHAPFNKAHGKASLHH